MYCLTSVDPDPLPSLPGGPGGPGGPVLNELPGTSLNILDKMLFRNNIRHSRNIF